MTVGGWRRAYGATVPATLLVLALAACSPAVGGSAAPQSGGGTTTSPSPRPDGCTVTANGTGSVNMSGGRGGSVVIRNRITTLSCGSGFVELTRITGGAVTFTADGGPVDIAVGATGTVGRYQVSVVSIEGGTVRFQMVPA